MAQNLVRLIRNLQRRNARRRLELAVAEGVRLVEEAVAAGVTFEGALVSPALARTQRGTALRGKLEQDGVAVEELSDAELADLADTDTPQGVLAVIEPRAWSVDDLSIDAGRPVLAVDAVQDPGNVGALIRTAHALGAGGVILLPGNARSNHPKVLRAAMGATFRLPVVNLKVEEFTAWLEQRLVVLWAAVAGSEDVVRVAPPRHLALLVGSEGSGVSARLLEVAHRTVSVPMAPGVDSLNVAVAAGILLHEILRND